MWYFDSKDQNRKVNCDAFLSSIIKQLSSKHADAGVLVENLRAKVTLGSSVRRPNTRELLDCLNGIIQLFTSVYIVVDALDECMERNNLVHIITTMKKWKLNVLHLLLVSRNEPDLLRDLKDLSFDVIDMEYKAIDDDIRLYIGRIIETDKDFKLWNNVKDKLWIEEEITKFSNGMQVLPRSYLLYMANFPRCVGFGMLNAK